MNRDLMLLPLVAMVLLTMIVSLRMFVVRVREMRAQRVRPQEMATRAGSAPLLKNTAAADNLMNLFEMPVLLYVFVIVAYVTALADVAYLALACLYVLLRVAHSFIHVTYNRVMHRFQAYLASNLLLWVLWGRLAFQLFERAFAGASV